MKLHILAVGRLKGAEKDIFDEYAKRLTCDLEITEIQVRQDRPITASLYEQSLIKEDVIVVLDEHGENVSSQECAKILERFQEHKRITFIIGGADGVPLDIKNKAKFSIAFGRATWPHLLVRVMLIEQLYRGQQILRKHPYHRA